MVFMFLVACLFGIVSFHAESPLCAEWSSGYRCPVVVIFQVTLVCSSEATEGQLCLVGGLHAVPCGVSFHW